MSRMGMNYRAVHSSIGIEITAVHADEWFTYSQSGYFQTSSELTVSVFGGSYVYSFHTIKLGSPFAEVCIDLFQLTQRHHPGAMLACFNQLALLLPSPRGFWMLSHLEDLCYCACKIGILAFFICKIKLSDCRFAFPFQII